MKSKNKLVEKEQSLDLEASLAEINSLIAQMEQGNLTLEQSLNHFERGIQLIKHSQRLLQDAENKVQILMQTHQNESLAIYESNEE